MEHNEFCGYKELFREHESLLGLSISNAADVLEFYAILNWSAHICKVGYNTGIGFCG